MEEAEFGVREAYVLKRHNKVAQYIATRPILDLCKEIVRRYGLWVARRCYYHEEGASPRLYTVFFKAEVHMVLLFGSETWVMTPCMGRSLIMFHHMVARRRW